MLGARPGPLERCRECSFRSVEILGDGAQGCICGCRCACDQCAGSATGGSAASADAAQPIYDVNDPVVTAVFTLATVALSVVTVGVAYLSITGWIDSRNEEAEKKRVEAAERSR